MPVNNTSSNPQPKFKMEGFCKNSNEGALQADWIFSSLCRAKITYHGTQAGTRTQGAVTSIREEI